MIWKGKKQVACATLVFCLMLSAATRAHASLLYYTDQASFTAAQSTAGNTFIGTEDFEESTQAAGRIQNVGDPLIQGVANGPFAAGLIQPLTIQSNTLGANATTTSPRGTSALATQSVGSYGASSDDVISNTFGDSFDLIFSPTQSISSVGFNPITFNTSGTLQVQVYDINNALLGTSTASGTAGGTTYYGIQATGTDRIGRINLFIAAASSSAGVDNVSFYQAAAGTTATPEPATWAMMAMGIIAMLVLAWRRKREEDEGSTESTEMAF